MANKSNSKHFLAHFDCCLGKIQPLENQKIKALRAKQSRPQIETISLVEGQQIDVTADLSVGDLLKAFPQLYEHFADINPLAMLSPVLDTQSIEVFLADTTIDPEEFCKELNHVLNQINE